MREFIGVRDMALYLRTESWARPHRAYGIPEKAFYVGLALLALTGAAMLYVLDPREAGNYPVCPFLGLTEYHCPGCGTLRALHQLLHGNPLGAAGYNLLTALSMPFIGYAFVVGALRAYRGPGPRPLFVNPKLIWGLFLGIVAFWVLRNVPVEPVSMLAP